jgi:hypothetical protein
MSTSFESAFTQIPTLKKNCAKIIKVYGCTQHLEKIMAKKQEENKVSIVWL